MAHMTYSAPFAFLLREKSGPTIFLGVSMVRYILPLQLSTSPTALSHDRLSATGSRPNILAVIRKGVSTKILLWFNFPEHLARRAGVSVVHYTMKDSGCEPRRKNEALSVDFVHQTPKTLLEANHEALCAGEKVDSTLSSSLD